MSNLPRREFLKYLSGAAALAAIGYKPAGFAKSSAHIVVVGGGFGGATCAKYIKRFDPGIEVTLIEANKTYATCPFSNTVIGGINEFKSITHGYGKLESNYNINVLHGWVETIDAKAHKLVLKSGKIVQFDRLVLAPGIDFQWDAIEGYDAAVSETIPHAWRAGPQTVALRKQIQAMPEGGTVIIAAPADPFRCPPGPYERASLIAHYMTLHKKNAKVLILDAKDKFSKQSLFQNAWNDLYGQRIEWVAGSEGGKVVKVDAKNMTVTTADGDKHKADVINLIPPQTAGAIARNAGLTNDMGWCAVNQKTFESKVHKDIHVIGDACIAGSMPKSGYAANSQAKVCAAEIVGALQGKKLEVSSWINTCYSLVSPDYGISVAAVYRLTDKGITPVKGSGGVGPVDAPLNTRRMEAIYAQGWYKSITEDMFS